MEPESEPASVEVPAGRVLRCRPARGSPGGGVGVRGIRKRASVLTACPRLSSAPRSSGRRARAPRSCLSGRMAPRTSSPTARRPRPSGCACVARSCGSCWRRSAWSACERGRAGAGGAGTGAGVGGARRPGTARADPDAPSPLLARGSLVAAEWRPEEGFVELKSPAVSAPSIRAAGDPLPLPPSDPVTLALLPAGEILADHGLLRARAAAAAPRRGLVSAGVCEWGPGAAGGGCRLKAWGGCVLVDHKDLYVFSELTGGLGGQKRVPTQASGTLILSPSGSWSAVMLGVCGEEGQSQGADPVWLRL